MEKGGGSEIGDIGNVFGARTTEYKDISVRRGF